MTELLAAICLVVGISDGDTLTARCGEPGAYQQVRVRISAIDAPEKGQPYGQRARQALAELCFQQQAAIAVRTRDRYGRVVADVQCQGKDVGQFMVTEGWAWVYDRYARGYSHLYIHQDAARAARRGLWQDPEPVPPWEWRAKKSPR